MFSTPRRSRIGTPGSSLRYHHDHRRVASNPDLPSPASSGGNAPGGNTPRGSAPTGSGYARMLISSNESVLQSSPYGLGNEHTELVLKLARDEHECRQLLEAATSTSFLNRNDAVAMLRYALKVSKEHVANLEEETKQRKRDLKIEFDALKVEFESEMKRLDTAENVLGETKGTEIATADDLLGTIMAVQEGSKPPKITGDFLACLFDYKRYNMQEESSDHLAVLMHVPSLEAIEALSAEEAHAILSFMSIKNFIDNSDFRNNLAFYDNHNILGEKFRQNMILGNERHTKETLHGLLAIYLRKLPEERIAYIFNPRKKGEVPEACWSPKQPTTATFTSHALSSETLAEQCGVATWPAIESKNAKEAHAILDFLASNNFVGSQPFRDNVAFYDSNGILPANFHKDRVVGSEEHTPETLHGLLGIYLRKLPAEALNFIFTPRKNGEVPKGCWERKTPNNIAAFAGAASAANPLTNPAPVHGGGGDMDDDDL